MLAAARDAFSHGMGLASVGAAVVMAAAALFSSVVLRGTAGKATSKAGGGPEGATLLLHRPAS